MVPSYWNTQQRGQRSHHIYSPLRQALQGDWHMHNSQIYFNHLLDEYFVTCFHHFVWVILLLFIQTSHKVWMFNLKIYETFVSRFLAEVSTVSLEELPRFLVLGLRNYVRSHEQDDLIRWTVELFLKILVRLFDDIPNDVNLFVLFIGVRYSDASDYSDVFEPSLNIDESLLDKLLPFQLEGIRFVVRHRGRALIADEMGCGKVHLNSVQ